MLTMADKPMSDASMGIVAALRELIGENDCGESEQSQPNSNNGQEGIALLETIRLLAKLSQDERAALIGLLKALA